ncbi:MAG TPA: cation:proton antiporter [Vicinamibacterales bacterium]|nr:cation:proton antiporter [Vicinamibacterales bacterium]
MHEAGLILTLAGGLAAALVCGYATHRIGLSPIVGYLAAGLLVGPYTPGFVADTSMATQLAEIGVILLMFGVGLQFHLDELLAVRRIAIPGAVVQSLAATVLGAVVVHALGWGWAGAIVFGLCLSVASTVVLVRVLSDARALHTQGGHIAVGWLVVEDLFTVIVVVLMPVMVGSADPSTIAVDLGFTLLKVAGLVAFTAIVGRRIIPVVLDRIAATGSRELFTLTVLVVALGIAVGSAAVFGVSMALGAFLAGMVVGRSDYSLRAATDALPMRDAFAVLFFVSVGMLLDPGALLRAPGASLAAFLIVVVAKPLSAMLMLGLARYPVRTGLTVGLALGQIGEFSFILITLARDLKVVPPEALDITVAVAIASITLNPLTFKAIDPIDRWLARRRGQRAGLEPEGDVRTSSSLAPEGRALVIGYGPTGRIVSRLLRENAVLPTVIDLNLQTVHEVRDAGGSAIYGDARHADTLITGGIRHAGTLIVSGTDTGAAEIIRVARSLNPSVRTFARGAFLRDVASLSQAGAQQVFTGEGEVALAMTEAVLRELGATPEQVERERARARVEIFGAADKSTRTAGAAPVP